MKNHKIMFIFLEIKQFALLSFRNIFSSIFFILRFALLYWTKKTLEFRLLLC